MMVVMNVCIKSWSENEAPNVCRDSFCQLFIPAALTVKTDPHKLQNTCGRHQQVILLLI